MNPDYGPTFVNLPFMNPASAYWFVGEDETQVYSSKRGQLVPVDDAEYIEWKKERGTLRAASLDDLKTMLAAQGL